MNEGGLEQLSKTLEKYSGRDKAIRIACFTLSLLSTKIKDEKRRESIIQMSRQLSRSRLISRLFSQFSLLISTLKILPQLSDSKDQFDAYSNFLITLLYVINGWVELIAWLAEMKIFRTINPQRWFQLSLKLWICAMVVGCIRTVRQILLLKSGALHERSRSAVNQHWLSLVGLISDLVPAINSLPERTLWSGMLSTRTSSSLYLLSSFIGFYKAM